MEASPFSSINVLSAYYPGLLEILTDIQADTWAERLTGQLDSIFNTPNHGDLARWLDVLAHIPVLPTAQKDAGLDAILVGSLSDIAIELQVYLETLLRQLHPWRKGPYNLFSIYIDSEWRSDWKWQRLERHISPLKYRTVLDVGCGNGYHCWRMLAAGAKAVVGIDPTLLSVMQFLAVKKLYGAAPIHVLPFAIEQIPPALHAFDTVFSMGVFYHRRSPIDHLYELKDVLKPEGELVLETLVIDGGLGDVLVPEGRYAQMRNVWFLPSCETLVSWLKRCGFYNVKVVDVSITTVQEQRSTDWMRFHSLQNFLDPDCPHLTVEGLPAPKRAVVIANSR